MSVVNVKEEMCVVLSAHQHLKLERGVDQKLSRDESQGKFPLYSLYRNLQRYMHYNSRWEAHVASQKLEAKQVADIREKIAELEDNGTELKDYTWLSQVLHPACRCCTKQPGTIHLTFHLLR